MADRYLLVCKACGNPTPVARRQAGESLVCACGATLEVPTLLQLQRLEKVPDEASGEAAARGAAWSVRKGVALAGGMIILAALGWAAYLLLTWPQPPGTGFRDEWAKTYVARRTPAETIDLWDKLRKGGLQPITAGEFERYDEQLFRAQISLGVAVFFLVIGAAIVFSAYLAGKARPAAEQRGRS